MKRTRARAPRPRLGPVPALLFLAAAVAGDPRPAGGESAEEEDAGWLELDLELEQLAGAATLSRQEGSGEVRYGVLIRAFYAWSEDEIGEIGGEDPSGFVIEDADVAFEFERGAYLVRISGDLDDATPELEDAYARWSTRERLELQLGSFKPRVLLSNAVDPDSLLFTDRTVLGAFFDEWDVGLQARVRFDELDLYASVTNGDDGALADHRWVARLEWTMFDAPWRLFEGAHGAPDYLRLILGGVYLHDDSTGTADARAFGFDTSLTLGPTALAGEWMDLDDGLGGTVDQRVLVSLPLEGGAQPFAATVSHRLLRDLEAAVRYQNLDDSADTELIGGALRWFPGGGPVSFVADVTGYAREGPDGIVVQMGVRAGTSRP